MRNSRNNQSMRLVWVVIPLVLFGIVGMQESFAYSCLPADPIKDFDRYDAIFLGTVLSGGPEPTSAIMTTDFIWKGNVSETVNVKTGDPLLGGMFFTPNIQYLIYSNLSNGSTQYTDRCGIKVIESDGKDDVEKLGGIKILLPTDKETKESFAEFDYISWTKQFGTNNVDIVNTVTVHPNGNIIVAGLTYGSLDSTNAGKADAFIRSYDELGNVLWTKQFGTKYSDLITTVTISTNGNIIVAGSTNNFVNNGSSAGDAFIRSYDELGNLVWKKQFGKEINFDSIFDAVTHPNGNIIVTGTTERVFHGEDGQVVNTGDAFIRSYDELGNVLWTKQLGTSENDRIGGLTVDTNGNILVASYGMGYLTTTGSKGDTLVRSYDEMGNILWTKQIGSKFDWVLIFTATTHPNGNIIVAGKTRVSLDDRNIGVYDAFIQTYDELGNILWTKQFGTNKIDTINTATVDTNGNIIVAGSTYGSLDGTNAGGIDAFVRSYDELGNILSTKQFGTNHVDIINSITVHPNGNIIVAGQIELDTRRPAVGDAFVRMYSDVMPILYDNTLPKLNSNEIDTSLNLDYEQISQLSKTLSDEIISIENIGCNDNLVKMFKSSDDSSVCVKPSTAEKLVQRGWGTLVN